MEKICDTVPDCGFGQTEINKWWKPNADLILQIGRAIRVAPIIFRGICGNGVAIGEQVDSVKSIQFRQFITQTGSMEPRFKRSNAVTYDEGCAPKLQDKLYLGDAISEFPAVDNNEPRDEMPYGTDPKTEFQKFIRLREEIIQSSGNGVHR